MNLFILGWNLPSELCSKAIHELRRMTEIYPQLDSDTLWQLGGSQSAFAACLHNSHAVAKPRVYVWQRDDKAVLYDGCMIDHAGGFCAWDAAELGERWQQLPAALEGQFAVARLSTSPPSLELLTDFLGMYQVYYLRKGDAWLISNSVHLICQIGSSRELDPTGASLFLTQGWVGGAHTLRRDVRVLDGGRCWKWHQSSVEPDQSVYFPRAELSAIPRRKLSPGAVQSLADDLVRMCQTLDRDFGTWECPLTGGRDSRLLACLLISGEIEAHYYTGGAPGSDDVQIGSEIARIFDLSHEVHDPGTTILDEWDEAARRLILQHDGMVSLWQLADILQQPQQIEQLRLNLWGIGGEIARGEYFTPQIILLRFGVEQIKQHLARLFARDRGGLIQPAALDLAHSHLDHFVEQAMADGFTPHDVPNVYYTFDRVRRWAGTNGRKSMAISDRFGPFCTRPFVRAAFSIPPLDRVVEPLHYELIRILVPRLHQMPFDKGGWRNQQPAVDLIRNTAARLWGRARARIPSRIRRATTEKDLRPAFLDRTGWFEAKRSKIREICLDQSDSPLWDLVNRDRFESHTLPDSTAAPRGHQISTLYGIATLFCYEAFS